MMDQTLTTKILEVRSLAKQFPAIVPNGLVAWIPGQGVRINYAAIIEILIRQLNGESEYRRPLSWNAE